MNNIELLVRAVIIKNNQMLLCRMKDSEFYFLPGGHIELGETASEALIREIKEELHSSFASPRYLGAIENLYVENNNKFQEYNFLFQIDLKEPFTVKESHIEFAWVGLDELAAHNIKPRIISTLFGKGKSYEPGFFLTNVD